MEVLYTEFEVAVGSFIILSPVDEYTSLRSMETEILVFESRLAGSMPAPVDREDGEKNGRLLAGTLWDLDGRLLPALI